MEHELFNKTKRPRKKQELKYDHKVGEILKKMRLWNYKTSDRFRAGIPDRYVASGSWIEFKYVFHALKKDVGTLREFSGAQRTTFDELVAHGDLVLACIFFDTPEGLRVYLESWDVYKFDAAFSPTRVMTDTVPWANVEDLLRKVMYAD